MGVRPSAQEVSDAPAREESGGADALAVGLKFLDGSVGAGGVALLSAVASSFAAS